MKTRSLFATVFAILILAACASSPPSASPSIETPHTATPSAPTALDMGTLGNGSARTAAWSADGKILAVASSRGIYLYDTTSWQILNFIEMQGDDYRNGVTQLWFHPDGKSLYYTCITTPYLLIYRYDLIIGESNRLYQGITFSEFTTIIFSPNGELFANIGATILNEKREPNLLPTIEIRQTATGKLLQTLKSDMTWWGSFQSGLASFSPDSALFATGGSDNIARVWNVNKGMLLFEQKHDADIQSLAFSPDGKILASAGNDSSVRFWEANSGKSLYVLRKFEHGLVYLAYSISGTELLLGTADGSFQQWMVDEHFLPVTRQNLEFKPGRREYTRVAASQYISPDGGRLVVINEANLQIFDLTGKNPPVILSEFNSYLTSIEYSSNGNLLALIDYNVHLWDANSHKVFGTLSTNAYEITDIAFDPFGNQVAVASNNIQIWDDSTFLKVKEIDARASQVAYSSDGTLLAAGGWNEVSIWNSDSGDLVRNFKVDLGKPFAISFSKNGERVMFIAQNGIRTWDIASGKLLLSVDEENMTRDHALFFSSDRALLEDFVNCKDGGKLNFWNLDSGQPLYTLTIPICGQGYSAIHPSEKLLAYISALNESSNIYLCDLLSGRNLLIISSPKKRMESLHFSPNGKILAAVESQDAVVHLWDISAVSHVAESIPSKMATALPTQTSTPSPTPAIASEIPLPLVTPQATGPNAITIDNVKGLTEVGTLGGALYSSSPYTAAWSNDDKQFAVGNLGAVYVYKTGTASPWKSFAGGGLVENLVFSPDGHYLAEQNNRDKVIVWDLLSGGQAQIFQQECGSSQLIFSADGKTLITDCPGETRRTFDLENGTLISQEESSRYGSLSPNGHLLVTSDSYYVYLKDARSGTVLHVFESAADPWLTSFIPNEETLLIWYYAVPAEKMINGENQTTYESMAELWNVVSGEEPILKHRIMTGSTGVDVVPGTGQHYAITSDGTSLITAIGDGFIRIWDINTSSLLREMQGGNEVFLSEDDKRLLTLGPTGQIQIWDLASIRKPKLLQTVTDFETQSYKCPISFANTGKEVLINSGTSIEKWKITQSFPNVKQVSYPLENGTGTFAASLGGNYWATSGPGDSIELRDPNSGKAIRSLVRSPQSLGQSSDEVVNLLFSNSGDVLAAANYWHIWLWDVKTSETILDIKPDFPIGDLALSPDGRLLAFSENDDGKAEIWDTQTGRRLRRFDFAGHQITFSPDGLTLASGWRNGAVSLLDIRSGQTIRMIQAGNFLFDLAFSPDGRLLAVKTGDGVEFWDAMQGRRLSVIDTYVSCMAFSPDGSIFATYGNEDRIRLWGVIGK